MIYDAHGNPLRNDGGSGYGFTFDAKFTKPGTVTGGNASTYIATERIAVAEGDKIEYSGRIRNGSICYIYSKDGNQIWKSRNISAAENDSGTITVPVNAAYAICNTMTEGHEDFAVHEKKMLVTGTVDVGRINSEMTISRTGTGNVAIRCAKEQQYTDGSSPVIEYFLLEEPETGRFFYSRDMKSKNYAFTFRGDTEKYSFGILANGDVIAVRDAASLYNETKDDNQRVNPFVFLASENWQVQHEVDFGNSLKPCGWLENCGFSVLPNGTAMFCEYTRMTVATANAWRIIGDPTNASSWTVTKTFQVTTTDNVNGFKHCHCIMHDQFTGIVYLSTGDSDQGAGLYYTTDNGDSWAQIGVLSEKYCRLLNLIFTENNIYWATDSTKSHYLFKATRDASGVIDWSSIVDFVPVPAVSNLATYGIAYLPEIKAALLLDRADQTVREMPLRIVDLEAGELHTITTIKSVNNGLANLGFRTRFSEWYPRGCVIRIGFDTRRTSSLNNAINNNSVFGNKADGANGTKNINNLVIGVYRAGSNFGINADTVYL